MQIYRKHTKIGSVALVLWLIAYIMFTVWFWTILPTGFWFNLVYFPLAGFLWVPVAIKIIRYCNKDNV